MMDALPNYSERVPAEVIAVERLEQYRVQERQALRRADELERKRQEVLRQAAACHTLITRNRRRLGI